MIPHTPLSFAYHVTLQAPYREELHTDLRESLRRFEIEAAFNTRFPATAAQGFRDFTEASFAVERAAFAGRNVQHPSPLVPMARAAGNLFGSIAPHLQWEIENRPSIDDQTVAEPNQPTLLWLVYHLFYSSAFRQAVQVLPSWTNPTATDERQQAWKVVHGALEGTTVEQPVLRNAIAVLTDWLAFEYSYAIDPIWTFCW